jgi:transposase
MHPHRKLSAHMNIHDTSTTAAVAVAQPVNHPVLKLALDVHVQSIVVAAMADALLKPVRRFSSADFLSWVKSQRAAGWAIVSCYEAGPLGFTLHRQLAALGVTNYVIRPRNWDGHHGRVKTDRTDARAMLVALDRFLAGQKEALALVRVPAEAEEQQRARSRLREKLVKEKKHLAQHGRGVALLFGHRLKGKWFGPRNWPRWKSQLPQYLLDLLDPLRQVIEQLHVQIAALTTELEASVTVWIPKGLGALTVATLEREVCDWGRFKNRRQVAVHTGLVPSEHSSGESRRQGSVTKCGNPRLRWALCEAAWRLVKYQPRYRLVRKWWPRLSDPHSAGKRKQAIVALARGFAVDWWRIRTGQTTPQKLGLELAQP